MQFSISFDPSSPDLASLSAGEQQAILDTANAAGQIWSRYLPLANVTLDLQIKVDNSAFGSGTLAEGRPGDFVATGNSFGGQQVYEAGSSVKLRTGQDSNGSQADLSIALSVASIQSMLFKTNEYAPLRPGEIDALSVFLREIEHGLGMYSLAGQPGASGVSVYDTFVQNSVSGPIFTGYNAILQFWWFAPGVPLDARDVANIDETAINPGQNSYAGDLMTPVVPDATNLHISGLDIAFLQDIGVPVRLATDGDDVVFAIDQRLWGGGSQVNGGDGNDTLYALADSSRLYGEDGDDRLIGNVGNDTLTGGAGDDYLEGGGGGNTLIGGTGFDIAHYFGLASDFSIMPNDSLHSIGYSVHAITSGGYAAEGWDTLYGIEAIQWGDGSITLLNTAAPVVTTQPETAHSNQTLALSSLFSVSDADGDAITAYRIYSGAPSGGPSNGVLTVNGASYRGAVLDVTPAQMPSVTFTAAVHADVITIQAFDGIRWSDWSQFTVSISPRDTPGLLWQNDSGQAAIWLMNGNSLIGGGTAGSNPGPSWHVKSAGDFDGDGKADILWQNDSGQAAIWLMNGLSGAGGGAVGSNPGPAWHVMASGDFDADGKADILWQNDSGQAAIWLMNGNNVVDGGTAGPNPGPTWHVKGAGDFDGDGKADILWQNDSGQAAIWLMNGNNMLGGGTAGSNPGPTWHVQGAGDFDGDGKADILWQNDSGQAAIWLMNGNNVLGGGTAGSNPGPSWHVKGAGDFDGDGKADILWQNDSGQAAVWLMNGNSLIGGGMVGSNPGTAWHLIAASG